MNEPSERIAGVRAFNRLYTRVIGVLDEGLVGTPHSLTEARVLYELAQQDVREVPELRRRLGLDPGYASRLLARLESQGLLTRGRSETDARRQTVGLTETGRATQAALEERTDAQIGELLGKLTEEDQRRLLSAMATVTDVLGEHHRGPAFVLRPPRSGDYGWVVQRHGTLYAQEYGFDATFEALVARIVADYVTAEDTGRQAAWIAELDGAPVGSVFCVPGGDEHTAKLRLLLVEPSARGSGVGKRLVGECLAFARASGYRSMELWTQSILTTARQIYRRAGFELAGSEPHRSWGRDLVAEVWRRDL
ncbi:bifunctional helix-turn-helix transcriptional regulator/GNAT family N-acetyltransferase [Prauserella muralis]|uniref:MarR family transcriptional regulator n=1 Tax=Prauserella muralis TaxID=588067 RepID=A0A2V4B8A0_9PSEU|nr:helix-turn-helix domain-containing GNAT family N-acetyltransferase [Prauserella muralis]PXY31584.1 MarR family transcriptional regulator [Prauserella muralis]TWE14056.1 MarR family transcriptional regulator with acetyltransferase activity [Prauserella muralis]